MDTTDIINWQPAPLFVGTKVEYKVAGTLDWIMPTTPPNPTTNSFYPLTVTIGVIYDVRLTTISSKCLQGGSITFQIGNTTTSTTTTTTTVAPTTTTSTSTSTTT